MAKRIPLVSLGWVPLAVLLIAGCQSVAPPPVKESPEPQAVQVPQEPLSEVVTRWLDEADRALSQDRLLEPADDNAHDRYRAVLYLDPGNSRAQSGLHAIVLRYLDMARSAAQRGAFAQSQELLNRANIVEPDSPMVQALVAEVQEEQNRQRQLDELHASEDSYRLDTALLSQRDEQLAEQLALLAQRIQDSGEFVLITSRTDDEGRWIYRQMQEAVPGYLVRGDIQLGSPPRVTFLPPL